MRTREWRGRGDLEAERVAEGRKRESRGDGEGWIRVEQEVSRAREPEES